jgi:hypothetical protein
MKGSTMSSNNNKFEFASRNKLRYTSTRGELTTEQLWDVPLRSKDGFNLDNIARTANRALKDLAEESFVSTERTPAQDRAEITLEVVKTVIETKLREEEVSRKRASNRAERERLLAILAEKQAGKLSEMSEQDLQQRIDALTT